MEWSSVVMVLMQFPMTFSFPSSKIYWTGIDNPMVYGRNVTLFCNTSAIGSQTTTWMKQSDVILHQGLSYYPDKYTGKDVIDGSTLIIMNVTVNDLNTSYTCLSDVYSFDKLLLMNSSNFICLPYMSDPIWTILNRTIFVQINISRVYPLPNCTIKINDILLSTIQHFSVHMQGVFYHGILNITSRYQLDICEMNMTVVCDFGKSHSDVIATYVLRNCKDFDQIWITVGACGSFVFLYIVTGISVVCKCYIKTNGKYTEVITAV